MDYVKKKDVDYQELSLRLNNVISTFKVFFSKVPKDEQDIIFEVITLFAVEFACKHQISTAMMSQFVSDFKSSMLAPVSPPELYEFSIALYITIFSMFIVLLYVLYKGVSEHGGLIGRGFMAGLLPHFRRMEDVHIVDPFYRRPFNFGRKIFSTIMGVTACTTMLSFMGVVTGALDYAGIYTSPLPPGVDAVNPVNLMIFSSLLGVSALLTANRLGTYEAIEGDLIRAYERQTGRMEPGREEAQRQEEQRQAGILQRRQNEIRQVIIDRELHRRRAIPDREERRRRAIPGRERRHVQFSGEQLQKINDIIAAVRSDVNMLFEAIEQEFRKCPICIEDYNGDDKKPQMVGCGHIFCSGCIRMITHCALCREQITHINTLDQYANVIEEIKRRGVN